MRMQSPIVRRTSRRIMVGNVPVGGDAPIAVQSMTNTDTCDVQGTLEQIRRLEAVGCDIVRVSVLNACAAFVLVHNHPSGDPQPSADDVALTERVARAGDLLGIRLLDHVIVAADGYASFLDNGLLTTRPR